MDSPPPPRGNAAVRRGTNQRKCSCSLSEPVQPTGRRRPSNAAPLLKRLPPPPGRRHPARCPPFTGGRPASVERRCRSPDLVCLGPSFDQAPPTRPPREQPPPHRNGGRRAGLLVSP